MNATQLKDVIQTLQDAGYTFPQTCPDGSICIIDPTCIWIPFMDFINNAWIVLAVITGFLLAGWGITLVRGANHDMVKNLRTLVLIFGVLSVAIPAVNFIGGGKFVVNQCGTVQVAQDQIAEILQQRSDRLEQPAYEYFEVIDSEEDGFNYYLDN